MERSVLRNWCNSNDPTAVDKDLQMERSADGCSRASDQNRKNLEGGWDCMLHERCCLRASERSTEQLGNAMNGWMGGPVAWAQKP